MSIDLAYFPHILDLILDSISSGTVRALRATNRAIRDEVDRRIVNHVLYICWTGDMFSRHGHVQLPFECPELAPQVRTLDFSPTDVNDNRVPDWLVTRNLPNLECVRLLGIDQQQWLQHMCDPPKTVIQLVRTVHTTGYHAQVGGGVAIRSERVITVLPSDLSTMRAGDLYWSNMMELGPWEKVLVFLPGLNTALGHYSDSLFPPADFFRCHVGHGSDEISATVVGCEECIGFDNFASSHVDLMAQLSRFCAPGAEYPAENVRFITLDQWRGEISTYEWEMVATLPDAVRFEHTV